MSNKPRDNWLSAHQWQEAIRQWHGGKDTLDIASEFNVHESVIYNTDQWRRKQLA